MIGKEGGTVGNRRKTRNYSDYIISQNIEKSPGDQRRLTVLQTVVKDRQLTFVWKTRQEWIIIIIIIIITTGHRNGIWHRKCAMLVMKSGKRHLTGGMELPNQDKTRTLVENETYKYLGILEADTIKRVQMKDKFQKEYLRRTRKLLETKLSSRNLIKGINTWTVPLVRYSGPFLKWTRDELKQMDKRTRKLMTMHKALYPRDDVDRLYVSREEGGRRLASFEDSVDASIQRLKDYIQKHDEGLITAIRNDTDNTMNNRMTITRKQKWEGKQLYGHFIQLINNISHDKTWTWLRKGNFKRETESLLIAAQNHDIRTSHIKARIDKTQQNRLCGDKCGDKWNHQSHNKRMQQISAEGI